MGGGAEPCIEVVKRPPRLAQVFVSRGRPSRGSSVAGRLPTVGTGALAVGAPAVRGRELWQGRDRRVEGLLSLVPAEKGAWEATMVVQHLSHYGQSWVGLSGSSPGVWPIGPPSRKGRTFPTCGLVWS
jgi:hypothetical protein